MLGAVARSGMKSAVISPAWMRGAIDATVVRASASLAKVKVAGTVRPEPGSGAVERGALDAAELGVREDRGDGGLAAESWRSRACASPRCRAAR